MNRRDFLLTLAASSLAACGHVDSPALPPGKTLGAGMALGHRLRGSDFPSPSETRSTGIAIVGGGIAGLSAAWKLGRLGFEDFRLFELEDEMGGNARAGQNATTAYPWGAHYLPLPGKDAIEVRELLADLGVLKGDPYAENPLYDERALCFAPQERLYRHGQWQEGLLPQIGVSKREQAQYRQFFALVEHYRELHDAAGRRAFNIPSARSSTDASLIALDQISMRDFLLKNGLDAAPLHWFVDYGCRDDYGCAHTETSAWAALHYFASRNGEQVLTWPEGNAWLARQMREKIGARITPAAMAIRIEETRSGVVLDIYHPAENKTVRWQARQLIFSAPAMVLPHVAANLDSDLLSAARQVQYAPWLVANLHLSANPESGLGAPLSWDNVLYDSPSLGYILATHQSLRAAPGPTVLTWYQALTGDSALARKRLLETPREAWAKIILADLGKAHPDIHETVEQLDIWRWGHAMSKPRPGWISSAARQRLTKGAGRIHLAHADLSGFSIFEEANYWGCKAATDSYAASRKR